MHHKIIKFITAMTVTVLLGGCAYTIKRTAVHNMTFQTGQGTFLPNNLRITLVKNPHKKVPVYARGFSFKIIETPDTMIAPMESYKAARGVFEHIGSISEETTFSPHLIADINKASCTHTMFKGSFCVATVDMYWGTGKFFRTYRGEKQKLAIPDAAFNWPLNISRANALYNSYVKVFESIVRQILADEALIQYFDQGFDDSLSSSNPNIPQLPFLQAKLQREAEEAQRKAQAETNRRDSEVILAKARSRGYALLYEIESVFSLGPVPSDLNALVLESLLPFSQNMEQAFEQANLQRVQSVSRQWRSWLKRCRGYVSQEAKDSIQEQLSYLDKLDRQFSDPALGELTMKLARAIKQERWEDAKNIQELIRAMRPPEPRIVETVHSSQDKSDRGRCERAKRDYIEAEVAYNNAKSTRDTRNNESDFSSIGSLGSGPGAFLLGLFSTTTKNNAKVAQDDMNHALIRMQDAKRRMSIHCGN